MEIKNQFAKMLMDIKAFKLQPNEPFTKSDRGQVPVRFFV